MRSPAPRGAFTMIELMVVLATMALLLGVLVPALTSVQSAGRGAACVSNLRRMSIAAQRYALDYAYFPPSLRYENEGTFTVVAWDWVSTFDDEVISPGSLWEFTEDPDRAQQCPTYHGRSNFADRYTGYNYNTTFLGGESSFPNLGWNGFRPGLRYGACRRAATVAIFGDGGIAAGVANKFMRAPTNREGYNLQTIYSGGQAFRHRHATNVAYIDLHVSAMATPLPGALATDALLDHMGYPANGFLSNDDRAYDPLWGLR